MHVLGKKEIVCGANFSNGSKQCSQNIFSYGFPHEGRRDSNKEQDKELLKR